MASEGGMPAAAAGGGTKSEEYEGTAGITPALMPAEKDSPNLELWRTLAQVRLKSADTGAPSVAPMSKALFDKFKVRTEQALGRSCGRATAMEMMIHGTFNIGASAAPIPKSMGQLLDKAVRGGLAACDEDDTPEYRPSLYLSLLKAYLERMETQIDIVCGGTTHSQYFGSGGLKGLEFCQNPTSCFFFYCVCTTSV
jgi:hypothetical protein